MARRAALISDRSHPLVPKIVFGAKRVVIRIGCRQVGWQSRQIDAAVGLARLYTARERQVIAPKRHNGIWIRRISGRAVNIRRDTVAVDDLTSRKSRIVVYERGVESRV